MSELVTRTAAAPKKGTTRQSKKAVTPLQRREAWNPFQDLPRRKDGTEEGLNTSQIYEFIRCNYRWHLRNRRMIDRREIVPSMDLGSAVHAAIGGAVLFYGIRESPKIGDQLEGDLFNAAWRNILKFRKEWIEEHGGQTSIAKEVDQQLHDICHEAYHIFEHNWEAFDLSRYEIVWLKDVPLVEQKIVIPFLPADSAFEADVGGLLYYGTPDVVWKDRKDNSTWVADYKVRKSMQSVEHEEVDLQLPAYQYMLMRLGIATVGSMKIQLRAALPKEPELTQKKTMSRQRIATTWEVYKRALVAHGLKPQDYEEEMKQKLDTEFFRLDRLYRNQFAIASFWDHILYPLGQQLIRAKEFIRHMHFINCTGCWAREFCLAELKGEDTDFLLQTQFYDATAPKPKMVLRPEDIVIGTEE